MVGAYVDVWQTGIGKCCSVVDDTKEYICKSMVTVIDHLGNVSSNLDDLISHTNAFSEAELRIQCLQQVSIASHKLIPYLKSSNQVCICFLIETSLVSTICSQIGPLKNAMEWEFAEISFALFITM